MITMSDYWMGRDKSHADELTKDIIYAAENTVKRANLLLAEFRLARLDDEQRHVTSGWRPPSVNATIPNAARRSHHMTGRAIDIADPDGDMDEWCLDNLDVLERCGLWLEHPSATKGWVHVQTVPPRSGRRVFYP